MGKYSALREPDTILGRPRFGYRLPDTDRMDRVPPNVDPGMLEFDPKVYNPGLFDPNARRDVNLQLPGSVLFTEIVREIADIAAKLQQGGGKRVIARSERPTPIGIGATIRGYPGYW